METFPASEQIDSKELFERSSKSTADNLDSEAMCLLLSFQELDQNYFIDDKTSSLLYCLEGTLNFEFFSCSSMLNANGALK